MRILCGQLKHIDFATPISNDSILRQANIQHVKEAQGLERKKSCKDAFGIWKYVAPADAVKKLVT